VVGRDANDIRAKCHNPMKSIHIHGKHKVLVQVVYLVGQIDSQPLEAKHRVIDENKLRGNLPRRNLLLRAYIYYTFRL
jgi:hypothetical protein